MTDTQSFEKILTNHYLPLLSQHGDSFESVNWGSQKSQYLRFKVLLGGFDTSESNSPSLLDVGCGVGHLLNYITENNLSFSYSGIDAIANMVEQAKASHRQQSSNFRNANLSQISDERFDYVVASGIFYVGCDEKRMQQEISTMFSLCKKGIAFNSLSTWANHKDESEYYADPAKTLDFCHSLTRKCVLRHDYMTHDFSIHLFRED